MKQGDGFSATLGEIEGRYYLGSAGYYCCNNINNNRNTAL